ncbi:MAG: ankyrin repeat domain-containing protein [Marinifilaceae bacterium]
MVKFGFKSFMCLWIVLLIACNPQKSNEELIQAIKENKTEEVKRLIQQGVDLNQVSSDGTALHLAIKKRQKRTALLLVEQGASLVSRDSAGLTPLHWALKRALPEVVKRMTEQGCDLNARDKDGYTPLNYAIKAGNQQNIQYLLRKGAKVYKNGLSEAIDGPYVDWTEKGMYAYYLKHDSLSSISFLSGKYFDGGIRTFTGWEGDSCTYHIRDTQIPKCRIKTQEPVFVLGDVHGQYDRMIRNLQKNGVIDEKLKWNWGKGHLVFVGDIFDRGNRVTEALWLIYRLEQEAEQVGGQVHLVFGNHELMVLNRDIRYIARKYKNLCGSLGLNYTQLFHPNSVLGEWLRSKNSVLQINDVLFVHGGISPVQTESGMTLEQINNNTRRYLEAGANPNNQEEFNQIMKSHGPFWYRGYFRSSSRYPKISEEKLTNVLAQLDVSTVVVGHTETEVLSSSFRGRIIDVNIPLAEEEIPNQALLIEDGEFYHLTENKVKKRLK